MHKTFFQFYSFFILLFKAIFKKKYGELEINKRHKKKTAKRKINITVLSIFSPQIHIHANNNALMTHYDVTMSSESTQYHLMAEDICFCYL